MTAKSILFLATLLSVCPQPSHCAEPDTLKVISISEFTGSEIPSGWNHILPKREHAYTNFSIDRDTRGPFLRAMSSGTSSWLEKDLGEIDVAKHTTMAWMWLVNQFPKTDWEMTKEQDDFAIRVELVYDYKGGKLNIFNIIRKGILTSIFKRYPPELIVSYVWALNVPPDRAYQSPSSKRIMIVPIESDVAMQGRWAREQRDIHKDLVAFMGEKHTLVLKKIRIRSDTESMPTVAESCVRRPAASNC